jgi:hypothetical protein
MAITTNIGVDRITRQIVWNMWKYGGEGHATQRVGKQVKS